VKVSLSIKRPNVLAWENGLLARVHAICLIIQLFYNTVSVIHRVGDLQISVEGSLTPCWKRRTRPMIIIIYLFILSSLLFLFSYFLFRME